MRLIKNIYKQAKQYNLCHLFTGKEDYEGIVRLLLSPQGTEFCLSNNFPDLNVFRKFLPYKPEKKGIYIDKGNIVLTNENIVFLVGNTRATVTFNNLETNYNVILMHGAKAKIIAENYAVVFVYGEDGENVEKVIKDNALIL